MRPFSDFKNRAVWVACLVAIALSVLTMTQTVKRNVLSLALLYTAVHRTGTGARLALVSPLPQSTTNSALVRLEGFTALVEGDYDRAAELAQLPPNVVRENPSLLIDQYQAELDRRGHALRDEMAGNLLERRLALLREGDQAGANALLEMVRQLRPFDLYVNSVLYLNAIDNSADLGQADAKALYANLTHFPIEAISSTSPTLRLWMREAASVLVRAGVWQPEQAERLDRFWRWQYPSFTDEASVKQSNSAPSIDTSDLPSSGTLAAELLQTNEMAVELGPELIREGGFDNWFSQQAVGWSWADMSGPPYFGEGLFVGGADRVEGAEDATAARVDGLWKADIAGQSSARAGFWYDRLYMPPSSKWLVTVTYRTSEDCPTNVAASMLLEPENPALFRESFLPSTGGALRREAVLLQNTTSAKVEIRPLLRNWAACTVWFDSLSIRPVRDVTSRPAEGIRSFLSTWPVIPVLPQR